MVGAATSATLLRWARDRATRTEVALSGRVWDHGGTAVLRHRL